ncbi:HNH endonuclease [Paracidovorax citrulli]
MQSNGSVIEIPQFVVDQQYSRREEITGKFGGSAQSGIAPSAQVPAIFLFTGETGKLYGYGDSFDDYGNLLYVGEGQTGDMTMTRGNRAIEQHAASSKALHVFKTLGKGKRCTYRGEFVYASHRFEKGPDKNGTLRDVIVFLLVPVEKLEVMEREPDPLGDADHHAIGTEKQDLRDLRKDAIDACLRPEAQLPAADTLRATYRRSARVRRYVLARADGRCELCDEKAPFTRKSDGTPYLEPHHINRLSDGGLDHPEFIGAICPTCHRRIHFGADGREQNERLRSIVEAREAEARM